MRELNREETGCVSGGTVMPDTPYLMIFLAPPVALSVPIPMPVWNPLSLLLMRNN